MVFDGRDYNMPELIPVMAYHSKAACIPTAVAGQLRAGYAVARQHGQLIGVQTTRWQYNRADLFTVDRLTVTGDGTTLVDIAQFYRRCHSHATHVHVACRFAALNSDGEVRHQVSVTDGAVTSTSSVEAMPIAGGANLPNLATGLDPIGPRDDLVALRVALDSNLRGNVCKVTVRADARLIDSGRTPAPYLMLGVTAWWGVEEE